MPFGQYRRLAKQIGPRRREPRLRAADAGGARAAAGIVSRGRSAKLVHSGPMIDDATAAFLSLALSRGGTVGAILPSSQRLAEAMAHSATGCAALIELGAGTGAITAALCRHHPGVPLLAVEMEPSLAQHLRQRFPRVEVRQAPAHRVLSQACEGPPGLVLVSSLPFRSLPPHLRLRSSLAIERLLCRRPDSRLVQYSYLPREPFALRRPAQLRWRRLGTVWGNTPPAWVWELKSSALPALP